MATQINWKIRQLERHVVNDVVTKVHWKCEVIDDGLSAVAQDVVVICDDLNFEILPGVFIPFKDLTEEKLIEWVKITLGPETIEKIESDLIYNIDIQKDIRDNFAYGLPWEVSSNDN